MTALLLAIDTVGSRCAVGVYDMDAARLLTLAEPDIGRGHAERLMDIIGDVLAEAGAVYGDLERIAVVRGPGSFTGLRVGVAAAKGLALALSIPAVGISTLEALAEPHCVTTHPDGGATDDVLCVIDAKRGELYAELFTCDGAVLLEAAALDHPSLAGWMAGMPRPERRLVLVGTGARIAEAQLAGHASHAGHPHIANETGLLDLPSLCRLGAMADPARGLVPLYLRGADAKPQARGRVHHAAGPMGETQPSGSEPGQDRAQASSILP